MTVWCLLLGREADGWKGMTREQQADALEPYLLDGERWQWSREGELFIVPEATGGYGQSRSSELTLDELQVEKQQRDLWAKAEQRRSRQEFQKAYVQATIDMAPQMVAIEQLVLDIAQTGRASTADRKLAVDLIRDWKNRTMGKPVNQFEDVGAGGMTPARELMASQPVVPVSARVTVEDVAEQQRRELEAGTLEVTPDA